ncbi:MAG: hypothetical protein ACI81I_000090 [Arcobacteraceae bacterium]|jgi:hypothetical protein
MTMPINLHPQYIIDQNGNKTSVVLSIDEFNTLIEQNVNTQNLSHLTDQVKEGLNSPILEQSHKEIFQELKNKYV